MMAHLPMALPINKAGLLKPLPMMAQSQGESPMRVAEQSAILPTTKT